jgi:hypothetical protein
LQWSEIKSKQTGDVPDHMQMEINESQNKDTLKMAPTFWKIKKILSE